MRKESKKSAPKQMVGRRVFLGWQRPILHAARDYLRERYVEDGQWDMDRVLVVLPGSLAVRRLAELLAESADDQDLLLRPPEIVTVGALPEKLYQARFPFATDLFQVLCWSKVLRAFPREDLKPLLLEVPNEADLQPWLELGSILSTLHRELATDLLSFQNVAELLAGTSEEPRWRVLQSIQRRYLDELSKNKFWDIQTARQIAINRGEPKTDLEIIVIGAVDLNQAQRRFLDAVAGQVTVLIGAPESWQEGFDDYGALKASFWQDIQVDVEDDRIHVRGTAVEAAEEVAVQLAKIGNTRSTQEITVGVPDPTLIPLLSEQMLRAGVTPRFGPGSPVDQSGPVRLLRCIAEYLDSGEYQSFASLVRLPIVADMLRRQGELPSNFLTVIDNYYSNTLIRTINLAVWPEFHGQEIVRSIVEQLDAWLAPLRLPSTSLANWSIKIRDVLRRAYEGTQVNLDDAAEESTYDALGQVGLAAEALADIPETFQIEATLDEAITWIMRQLAKSRTAPPPNPNAIEMLGWLDLALDDTPLLILTGLHDGVVPESVNADPFLPNEIRSKLGLVDNARRYARDCYAFQTMVHSRQQLEIVLHQLGVEGDPVTPSRLLLAVPPDRLGHRVLSLISPVQQQSIGRIAIQWRALEGQTEIPIPLPETAPVPMSLYVTDFRKYLECPYRFYLGRIKGLTSVDDVADELGANVFGTLLHECLSSLKDSPVKESDDPEKIAEWLCQQLDTVAKRQFGTSMLPAVQIQVAQARLRFEAFAQRQAEQIRDGWRIHDTEIKVPESPDACLDVDGIPMPIRARIDRIDYHPGRKEWAIWDYKTSDSGKKPVQAHFSRGEWQDLQLPLYRHLAPALKLSGTIKLGYINLPKSTADTAFAYAEFTEDELLAADEVARGIVRSIRKGEYWPPNYQNVPDWDSFGVICQSNLARRWDPSLSKQVDVIKSIRKQIQETANLQAETAEQLRQASQQREQSSVVAEPFQLRAETAAPSKPPVHLAYDLPVVHGEPPKEWFNPLVNRASAGTGKTYQLAMRMIRLLFTNQPLDHVLATTFTRKAAGEILKRVLSDLAHALVDDSKLRQLQSNLEPLKVSKEDCQLQLARLCSNLHRYRVSTLDAFYSQLARNFSLELNLPPGWSLADSFQEMRIRNLAIAKMFDEQDQQHLRNLLSMLFKGEAGRGIQSQIREVVESGYELFRVTEPKAWQVLPVPLPPKQEEVAEAIDFFSNYEHKHKNVTKIIRALADKIKAEDWIGSLKSTVLSNCDVEPYSLYRQELDDQTFQAATTLRKYAVHQEFTIRAAQNKATYELLASYDKQLEAVKHRTRTLTFDDVSHRLANWIVKLEQEQARKESNADSNLVDPAEIERIDWRMDARIDHLLLDEFQDTAPNQWKIIQPFAEAIARENMRCDRSFFCVGDMKQAIYGWRGGVAEIFGEVSQRIQGVIQEQLTKSWRSSPEVIGFVNRVFENLDKHPNYGEGEGAIQIWRERFVEHQTAKNFSGYICLVNGVSSKNASDEAAAEEESLMQRCADEIKQLTLANQEISIGVLVRRNVDVAAMIHLLRELKIDASQEGGNPLTDSAAVELVLSIFRYADHPGDSVAAFHIDSSGVMEKLRAEYGIELKKLPEQIRRRVDQTGIGPTIAFLSESVAPLCNLRDQQRLEQLIQQGYQYDSGRSSRVRDFVEFVEQQKIATPRPAQVRVMTIHQSKGLEFDAVFLPTLPQQNTARTPTLIARVPSQTERPDGVVRYFAQELLTYLPSEWRDVFREHAEKDLTENLCLFYVALTRARRALYMYSEPHDKPQRAWSSILCSILDEEGNLRSEPNSVVYESGDATWYESDTATDAAAKEKAVQEVTLESPEQVKAMKIELVPGVLGRLQRMRLSLRPSSVGEARMVVLEKALDTSKSMGQIVGTLIHRWFEEVIWLDDFHIDRNHLKSLAIAALTPEQLQLVNLDQWLDQFVQWLASSCVQQSIGKARYDAWRAAGVTRLEVTNERNLLEILDGCLVRGTIDRLVLGYQGERIAFAEILDYKTDAYQDGKSLEKWIEERSAHHAPQLQMYRRVLEKQFGLSANKINMTLIMLSGNVVVPIATSTEPGSHGSSIAHDERDSQTVAKKPVDTLSKPVGDDDDDGRQLLLF